MKNGYLYFVQQLGIELLISNVDLLSSLYRHIYDYIFRTPQHVLRNCQKGLDPCRIMNSKNLILANGF